MNITIYRGPDRITDIAILEQKWGIMFITMEMEKINEQDYGIISEMDPSFV